MVYGIRLSRVGNGMWARNKSTSGLSSLLRPPGRIELVEGCPKRSLRSIIPIQVYWKSEQKHILSQLRRLDSNLNWRHGTEQQLSNALASSLSPEIKVMHWANIHFPWLPCSAPHEPGGPCSVAHKGACGTAQGDAHGAFACVTETTPVAAAACSNQ